jgi:hypothetical protein
MLMAACHSTLSGQAEAVEAPRDPQTYPLRFKKHNFEAYCYNTLSCQVVYAGLNQSVYATGKPASAPPSADYRDKWPFASHLGIRNFAKPAEVTWTTLSGQTLQASVDLGAIFKDERVLHEVPEAQLKRAAFKGPVPAPSIYLEVNDRTISVYMKSPAPDPGRTDPGQPAQPLPQRCRQGLEQNLLRIRTTKGVIRIR